LIKGVRQCLDGLRRCIGHVSTSCHTIHREPEHLTATEREYAHTSKTHPGGGQTPGICAFLINTLHRYD
jgi:hypothetical protein